MFLLIGFVFNTNAQKSIYVGGGIPVLKSVEKITFSTDLYYNQNIYKLLSLNIGYKYKAINTKPYSNYLTYDWIANSAYLGLGCNIELSEKWYLVPSINGGCSNMIFELNEFHTEKQNKWGAFLNLNLKIEYALNKLLLFCAVNDDFYFAKPGEEHLILPANYMGTYYKNNFNNVDVKIGIGYKLK